MTGLYFRHWVGPGVDGLPSGTFHEEIRVSTRRTFHWDKDTVACSLLAFILHSIFFRCFSKESLSMWTVEQHFMVKVLKPSESGELRERRRKKWKTADRGKEGRWKVEGRGWRKKAEKKGGKGKKSEGENKFAPGFYLNLLIRSKACPKDMLLSFSGWALQWNSCVGGISTCDSCFMWEMNLPVMWETVGNEQAVLRCDLTLKSGRIMAHKALEWEGQGPERSSWCAGWEITERDGTLPLLWGLIKLEVRSQ